MSVPPASFPIHEVAGELLATAGSTNRVMIEAPTGSGKSTQVPAMLLDAGLAPSGRIVVMEPRRIAARMLARFVARQRGAPLGDDVGYQVRLERVSGPRTRLCYETEGVLLRQWLVDPRLSDVSILVFDEFHERHLEADVMLALARRLQEAFRPDLKLIIMSATLDAGPLAESLGPCGRVVAPGRLHPVRIEYLDREPSRDQPVWETAVRLFHRVAVEEPEGDVLIFMPGAYEIRRTLALLEGSRLARGVRVFALHGDMSIEEQEAALAPCPDRKVVVATNVAETSLTIPGVRLVLDSGLARKARFDPRRGINTLLIEKISRSSADQRAGRAGRTAPGRCWRLWTERDHLQRPAQELPEILRTDLTEVVLLLKAAGVEDLAALPWLTPPDARLLDHAATALADLGALDGRTGRITDLGRRLAQFPVHPRYGRMLIEASARRCVPSAALLAALSQERSLFTHAPRAAPPSGATFDGEAEEVSDHVRAIRAWRYAERCGFDPAACEAAGIHAATARRVAATRRQFLDLAASLGFDNREQAGAESDENLRRCILAAFPDHVARRASPSSGRFLLVHGRRGVLAKDTAARRADWVVATEIQEIGTSQGQAEVRLCDVSPIEPRWLQEMFPDDVETARVVEFDPAARRVVVVESLRFRDLVIEERRGGDPTDAEAAEVLTAKVLDGTLVLRAWNHAVEQWIERVNLVARVCPDLKIPPITDEAKRDLIRQICLGARGYKDIKDRPVLPLVRARLSPAQAAEVDRLAPERVSLPNGKHPRVVYAPGQPPTLAAPIQHLYGVTEAPRLVRGQVPVVIQILAPNGRPVQVTSDLASFWREGYPRIKRELARRYPKHEWR